MARKVARLVLLTFTLALFGASLITVLAPVTAKAAKVCTGGMILVCNGKPCGCATLDGQENNQCEWCYELNG
jgi:hypothetical protein